MFFLAMDPIGSSPKEIFSPPYSFVAAEKNSTDSARRNIIQASVSSRSPLDKSQNAQLLKRSADACAIRNYGTLEEPSPVDSAHSFSPLSSSEDVISEYEPEGVLRKIQTDDLISPFSCSPENKTLKDALPTSILLDAYWEDAPFPKNSFSKLFHELSYLQNYLSPAAFREQAITAIEKKISEKESLQLCLSEKISCLNDINTSPNSKTNVDPDIPRILETEISEIEVSISFITVFVAYHKKLIALNDYIYAYNHLSYFSFPLPEERIPLFEKATLQLELSLKESKKANQALLEKVPEHPLNKSERDFFIKIVAKEEGDNPFQLGLYRSPGGITPITKTNDWLRDRLKKDLSLTLPEETTGKSSCIIN